MGWGAGESDEGASARQDPASACREGAPAMLIRMAGGRAGLHQANTSMAAGSPSPPLRHTPLHTWVM